MLKYILAILILCTPIYGSAHSKIDKDGYQIIENVKLKYPNEFIYSRESTNKVINKIDNQADNLKSVTVYLSGRACGRSSAMITTMEFIESYSVTAKSLGDDIIESIKSFPNVKVQSTSVDSLLISGIEASKVNYIIIIEGTLKSYYGIQILKSDENKVISIAFINSADTESELKKTQSCVNDIIDTIQIIK